MLDSLKTYGQALGQSINIKKSGILFSNNTSIENNELAMSILGINETLERDFYLGLPLLIGRNKIKEFRAIKDRIRSRIQSWEGNYFLKLEKQQ